MIVNFKNKLTGHLFYGVSNKDTRRFRKDLHAIAKRKLDRLNAETDVNNLRMPPSNHLEKLSGDRSGQYSIRINNKWRICFNWINGNAHDVEITDYH